MKRFSHCALCAAILMAASGSQAAALKTIGVFDGGPGNGAIPRTSIIADSAGNLFGGAQGGPDNRGVVFEIAKNGDFSDLASLGGPNDPDPNLVGNLVIDTTGNLFGTTYRGGAFGAGQVFEVSPAGVVTTRVSFDGVNTAGPSASIVMDTAGNFFGTATNADRTALVYKLGASGELTTLATLDPGDSIAGGLAIDAQGNLFGTHYVTSNSSPYDEGQGGSVFELTQDGKLTTLATLTFATSGFGPDGDLTLDAAGNVYGTTFIGGPDGHGTVFEVTKGGLLVPRASFNGSNGDAPEAGVIVDAAGNIFGTTLLGGAFDQGTIFRISPDGTLTTLVDFSGPDGARPYGDLFADAAGNLFGTTQRGGAPGDGTVFELLDSGFVSPATVPEPSTWMFMLAGFGLIGAAARRKQNGVFANANC